MTMASESYLLYALGNLGCDNMAIDSNLQKRTNNEAIDEKPLWV